MTTTITTTTVCMVPPFFNDASPTTILILIHLNRRENVYAYNGNLTRSFLFPLSLSLSLSPFFSLAPNPWYTKWHEFGALLSFYLSLSQNGVIAAYPIDISRSAVSHTYKLILPSKCNSYFVGKVYVRIQAHWPKLVFVYRHSSIHCIRRRHHHLKW